MTDRSFDAASLEAWLKRNRPGILDALAAYLSIPTPSPQEDLAFPFLEDYLGGVGFDVRREEFHPDIRSHPSFAPNPASRPEPPRANIRAARPPREGVSRAVTFNCHVDVVPEGADFPSAFSPEIRDDRVVGRGACDTKNNLIMLVEAIRFLDEQGIPPTVNVKVDLAVEEEIGGNGTLSMVLHGVESDEVVVLETTELNVFRGQRGCLGFSIALTGRSVHMGSHATGISAIEAAYDVLVALKAFEQEMLDEAGTDPDFLCWEKPVKLNLGIIRGGDWPGTVPDWCRMTGNLGFLPGYGLAGVEEEIRARARRAVDPWVGERLEFDFGIGLRNDGCMIPEDACVVTELTGAARRAGIPIERTYGWKISCDAGHYINTAGVPTVIFGSGSPDYAHSAEEHVLIDELFRGILILADYLSCPREG